MNPGTAIKPRLLVLASTYPRWANDPEPGFVHELTRRMTETFRVLVLCPRSPGAARSEIRDGVEIIRYRYAPAALETLVNDGGIVGNLKKTRWKWLLVPGFLLALLWNAWRIVRKHKPQVIHAHWLVPQGFVAALLSVVEPRTPPFLATSHGADLYTQRSRLLLAIKRFVTRRADTMTVVSEGMLDELSKQNILPVRLEVQSMGVDLTHSFRPSRDVERIPAQLLFVGRMVEKKGLHQLIAAMPTILAQRPDVTLVIAGFGPDEMMLRAQTKHLGVHDHVRFLGAVSQAQLPHLYRQSSIFVAPFIASACGDQDGLGLVSIEAAGCGCRLILGNVPAVRSAFHETAEIQLVNALDTNALANACLRALTQPQTDTASIEPLRARFDWDVRAAAYASILHSIATRANP